MLSCLFDTKDPTAESWVIEVGRPPSVISFDPESQASRLQFLEIDPTGPAEWHKLDDRFPMLGDNDALAVLSGGDELSKTRLRFT